jgi:glycosyltransferase involved in cell wall biosynthesis
MPDMNGLNVLISAYACRPGEGSEPGVGWNLASEVARYHRVWVLTRENNRAAITAELAQHPQPNLQVIYCDLPTWLQRLNRGQRIVYLHYYGWQIAAYRLAKSLHQSVQFDVVHHVTYVRYAAPSFLSLLPIPFIWGPVGGGESLPDDFWADLPPNAKRYERLRNAARWLGELDPFVGLTARRSQLARATTAQTAQRLEQLGAAQIEITSQLGLSPTEISKLQSLNSVAIPLNRFVSIGRLLHWKGFYLGLQAFAQANLPETVEYWIVGDGPERQALQALAEKLGIARRTRFLGKQSRQDTLNLLAQCSVLVHPSLHDSGGLVCLEAMAAGRPVICLDWGGPALQVTTDSGVKIPVGPPEQVVQSLAIAMTQLATDDTQLRQMSVNSQARVQDAFTWEIRGQQWAQLYVDIASKGIPAR